RNDHGPDPVAAGSKLVRTAGNLAKHHSGRVRWSSQPLALDPGLRRLTRHRMSKRFTLEEAQGLLPEVGRLLRSAIDAKAEYQEAERAIQEMNERIMLMGGIMVDRDRALDSKTRREQAAAILRNAIEGVQEIGCQVKD